MDVIPVVALGTHMDIHPRALSKGKGGGGLVMPSLPEEVRKSDYLWLILGRNKEVYFPG